MNFSALYGNTPALLSHFSTYGLFVVLFPLVALAFLKTFLSLRSNTGQRKSSQWILSGEYDENGLPRLARVHAASEAARYRAALAEWKARSRR